VRLGADQFTYTKKKVTDVRFPRSPAQITDSRFRDGVATSLLSLPVARKPDEHAGAFGPKVGTKHSEDSWLALGDAP